MERTFSHKNNDFVKFLEHVGRESGKIIKKYFNTDVQVEQKEDATPVTIADRFAEETIRKLITKEFPAHGIIGEELGETDADAQYVWTIDPIDGTKSFVAGVPLFGTLIALVFRGEPVIGVIANPILDIFLFGDNEKSFLNGRPVACRQCASLAEAALCTTSPRDSLLPPLGRHFESLTKRVKLYRSWGDCFGYYLLARGSIDIMTDPVMKKWDSFPLIPIVRGAKGVITNWRGENPVLDPTNIVAASAGIHAEVIRILNQEAGENRPG
jgi:myo-inositol-1(or 4)-monophosphatase